MPCYLLLIVRRGQWGQLFYSILGVWDTTKVKSARRARIASPLAGCSEDEWFGVNMLPRGAAGRAPVVESTMVIHMLRSCGWREFRRGAQKDLLKRPGFQCPRRAQAGVILFFLLVVIAFVDTQRHTARNNGFTEIRYRGKPATKGEFVDVALRQTCNHHLRINPLDAETLDMYCVANIHWSTFVLEKYRYRTCTVTVEDALVIDKEAEATGFHFSRLRDNQNNIGTKMHPLLEAGTLPTTMWNKLKDLYVQAPLNSLEAVQSFVDVSTDAASSRRAMRLRKRKSTNGDRTKGSLYKDSQR